MSCRRGPQRCHPPKHASKSISKPCTISLVINCFCAASQEFRNFIPKKGLRSLASGHLVLKLLGQLCLRVVLKVAQHLLPRNLKCWEVRHQWLQVCLLSAFDLFQSRPEKSASYQVPKTVFFSLYLHMVACWWLWISRLQPGTTLVEVSWSQNIIRLNLYLNHNNIHITLIALL